MRSSTSSLSSQFTSMSALDSSLIGEAKNGRAKGVTNTWSGVRNCPSRWEKKVVKFVLCTNLNSGWSFGSTDSPVSYMRSIPITREALYFAAFDMSVTAKKLDVSRRSGNGDTLALSERFPADNTEMKLSDSAANIKDIEGNTAAKPG